MPEGDAERYKRILSTFFGLANDCLRNGELKEMARLVFVNGCPAFEIIARDED